MKVPPHYVSDTNAIESLNYQLRKVTKTRGHFPTDDAVLKISTWPSKTSEHREEEHSDQVPWAGNEHSTRSPSPSPDASNQPHEPLPHTKYLTGPLDTGLLVDIQHHHLVRRVEVQPNHITDLVDELRFLR